MGNYVTLEAVKSDIEVDDNSVDAIVGRLIPQAEAFIERYCDRVFYAQTATRYFPGAGRTLFIDDLLSVTTFKLDEDGDGTFESTLAATDYVLFPLNENPKTWVELSQSSSYGGFAAGVNKGVEIAGSWGYDSTVPEDIRRAALIQVVKWFKRKNDYSTVVGGGELGEVQVHYGLDPDIKMILAPFVKRSYP